MFHAKLLKPAVPNDDKCFPNRGSTCFCDFGDDPGGGWLVDSVVNHKFTKNSINFNILWDTGRTTCEPLAHCKDLAALDNYLELHGVTRWRDLPRTQKHRD